MGDVPPGPTRSHRGAAVAERTPLSALTENQQSSDTHPQGVTQSVRPALRSSGVEYYTGSHGFVTTAGHGPGPSSTLNMGDMAATLPAYQPPAIPFGQQTMQQHFIPAHQSQGMVYSVQQLTAFPGQAPGGNPAYTLSYSSTFQTAYTQQQHQHTHLQHGATGYQPYLQNPSTHQSTPVSGQAPMYGQGYYAQQPYATPFGHGQAIKGTQMRPQSSPQKPSSSSQKEGEERDPLDDYDVANTIVDGSSPMQSALLRSQAQEAAAQRQSSNTLRGPPRKPKQSGHALWVGNLPPGASVVDLKDHFSRDATDDIESVFLISKSNCAFVNYKTEAACTAAMTRFHDSRFQGVRLVCRLRRGLAGPGSSTNPAAASVSQSSRIEEDKKNQADDEDNTEAPESGPAGDAAARGTQAPLPRVPERFFIVKSLTVEDLELSRQSGIWATQTHNEANLNRAYESADNVYLIFSANKSGEYFGYARMISPINDDEALEMPARPDHIYTEPEVLNVTPTEATATAPKGRIIDDSARGTIFWEADSSEDEDDGTKSEKSVEEAAEDVTGPGTQSFGKPFRIEWLSTERVPFYRTRGLRNPWNANREVKIARDGTEIEPSVGRKLTQLFHLPPAVQATALPPLSGQQLGQPQHPY
ncbi:hypothetical protein VTN02DRAFT_4067 [Thermoascus thermophilus]